MCKETNKERQIASVREAIGMTDKGTPQTIENILIALQADPDLDGAVRYNQLTSRVECSKDLGFGSSGSGIRDVDVNAIKRLLESRYKLRDFKRIDMGINLAAHKNAYHPIRDRLEKLVWDGSKRIENILPKYLGAEDTELNIAVIHLLLQAAIHRVYQPGCKYEIMICLVGGQGGGKSSFVRLLAMDDDWYGEDLKDLGSDKVYQKLQGHWIIEMSEMLATANAKSVEEIKSFLSCQKETYKIPYEKHPEDRPRQCVFLGTSNDLNFLPLDRSGNRRFVPIMTHPERAEKHILADEEEARAYIMQVWAEAMVLYRDAEKHVLKLPTHLETKLTEIQKDYMPEDAQTGIIQHWLDNSNVDLVCTMMLYHEALQNDGDPKRWELKEINEIMNFKIRGWVRVTSNRKFERYGYQRAWERTHEFLPADDTEQPFD